MSTGLQEEGGEKFAAACISIAEILQQKQPTLHAKSKAQDSKQPGIYAAKSQKPKSLEEVL